MRISFVSRAACLCLVVLLCNCTFGTANAEGNQEPVNVVMIWIDALRADHLGCYGYPLPTSPNIDKLAETSVLLMNHHTPHTYTIGSFMSMITSLYPSAHGVNHVGKDVLSPDVPTFAEIMNAHDYKTAWFGPQGCAHLDPDIGYGRGFDEVGDFPWDTGTARKFIQKWLRDNSDGKFFLNFHTYRVHSPYYPGAQYRDLFSDALIPGLGYESQDALERAAVKAIQRAITSEQGPAWELLGKELCGEIAAQDLIPADGSLNRQRLIGFLQSAKKIYKWDALVNDLYNSEMKCDDPRTIDHFISLYDATIRTFDSEILGPVITLLTELELLDKTIIIIAADHGEEFCEHGRFGHGTTLFDEVTHVPLIVRLPGIGSKRIESLTQTVDLLPTILEVLRIPVPEHAQGISFLPLIANDPNAKKRRYVYGQIPLMKSIRSVDYKLVLNPGQWWMRILFPLFSGEEFLYDLRSDPLEMDNVIQDHYGLARQLKSDLHQWQQQIPTYSLESTFSPDIDEATRERVKKTGYW